MNELYGHTRDREYLDPTDCACLVDVQPQSIHKAIRKGTFPHEKYIEWGKPHRYRVPILGKLGLIQWFEDEVEREQKSLIHKATSLQHLKEYINGDRSKESLLRRYR